MLGKTYSTQNCSAARALELVGERWSLLILRDSLFRGVCTYGDFQKRLGIATNILAARLEAFVANGLFKYQAGKSSSDSGIYLPTEKALELKHVIMALTEWGDKWSSTGLGPIDFRHHNCGGHVTLEARCNLCAAKIENSKIDARSRASLR